MFMKVIYEYNEQCGPQNTTMGDSKLMTQISISDSMFHLYLMRSASKKTSKIQSVPIFDNPKLES